MDAHPTSQRENDSVAWNHLVFTTLLQRFNLLQSGDRIWMGDHQFLTFLHPDFRAEHLTAMQDHYVVDLRKF